MKAVIIAAVAATVVTLFVVLVSDFRVGQAMTMPPATKAVPIKVVGHQYWWEVQYPDSIAQNTVITANEIHIPVGKPIVMELVSRDVIHSYLGAESRGKEGSAARLHAVALVSRRHSRSLSRANAPSSADSSTRKWGLLVIAEPQEQFDAWISAQRSAATPPSDSIAQRGKHVFEGTTCVMCHAIGGTTAGATTGPDLTHIASRQTIAAGTLVQLRRESDSSGFPIHSESSREHSCRRRSSIHATCRHWSPTFGS